MLNSSTIELILGMVFIYLVLSLIVSTIREGIEARLKTRSQHLARGIAQLLNTPQAADLFYRHPMVASLYAGDLRQGHIEQSAFKAEKTVVSFYRVVKSFFAAAPTQLPSYIPRNTFALTLLQLVAKDPGFLDAARSAGARPVQSAPTGVEADAIEAVSAAVEGADTARTDAIATAAAGGQPIPIPPLPTLVTEAIAVLRANANDDNPLARSMLAALSTCDGDINKAVTALGAWYDGTMDRVSGWYKRESQSIMFWLGVIVAIGLNVDSIYLVKYLHSNDQARAELVSAANMNEYKKLVTPTPDAAGPIQAAKDALDAAIAKLAAAPDDAKKAASADVDAAQKRFDAMVLPFRVALNKATTDSIRRATDLNLPIGWTEQSKQEFFDFGPQTALTIVGWFFTAFALSLGAPFWFDLLNRIMVVRSTVKPSEKSPDKAPDEPTRKN